MRDRNRLRLAGLGIALAVVLAGCGNDDGTGVRNLDGTQAASGSATASGGGTASGSGTASGQAAACKPVGDAGSADATVAVDLKEWSITPARADVPAGTIAFEARNTGKLAHELVVVRGDDPAALPLAADGTVDEDKLPEGAFVGEIEAFPAGQTCTGAFALPAGSYALFCNLLDADTKANHYANGMRTRFEVRG